MPSFEPSVHGFHFSNNDITWHIPAWVSPVGSLIEFHALCGGMVYAALDYFHSGIPIPPDTTPPPEDSALHDHILSRQNSAHVSTIPIFGTFYGSLGILPRWDAEGDLAKIRSAVNAGPVPLCTVRHSGAITKGYIKPAGHHVLALSASGGSTLSIEVYDPNWPDRTTIISGNFSDGFKNSVSGSWWSDVFVDTGWKRTDPPDLGASKLEGNWRWCNQCMGLFWSGDVTNGSCPATRGQHLAGGVKVYKLSRDYGSGERQWKWCKRCEGLFWGGEGAGQCPATGGGHDTTNPHDYALLRGAGLKNHENGWRYCESCRILFWGGDGRRGACPAGTSGHDTSDSSNYFLRYS